LVFAVLAILVLGLVAGCGNETKSVTKETLTSSQDIGKLFPDYSVAKKEFVNLGQDMFAILGLYNIEKTDNIYKPKIVVCKYLKDKNSWQQIWEYTNEDISSIGYQGDTVTYYKTFLLAHPEGENVALAVTDIYLGGAHPTSDMIAFTIDQSGKCTVVKNELNEHFQIEKSKETISIRGDDPFGLHKLYIKNNKFAEEITPVSKLIPSNAIKVYFKIENLNGYNQVKPVDNKTVYVKAGDTIAFAPANEQAEEALNNGDICVYAGENNDINPCEANRLRKTIFTFEKNGYYYFSVGCKGEREDTNKKANFIFYSTKPNGNDEAAEAEYSPLLNALCLSEALHYDSFNNQPDNITTTLTLFELVAHNNFRLKNQLQIQDGAYYFSDGPESEKAADGNNIYISPNQLYRDYFANGKYIYPPPELSFLIEGRQTGIVVHFSDGPYRPDVKIKQVTEKDGDIVVISGTVYRAFPDATPPEPVGDAVITLKKDSSGYYGYKILSYEPQYPKFGDVKLQ
jgi:hypothetical protein